MKKIMSIEDLVRFCEEQNFAEFDSKNAGYQLCVSMPAEFEQEESNLDSMMFANVKAFHTNKNNNGSNVTKEAMQNSLQGFAYKPILCNYQTVTLEDGSEALDFTAHDMDVDSDGNVIYLEKQVGCITADEPVIKYDRSTKRYYVYAKCAIPREYTPAADIIDRRGGTDVSAELYVNKMSYDAKKKELLLEDIELAGITLLGADRKPGMAGSHLQIEDFAADENNMHFEQNDKLIETLEALNKTLEELKINNANGKEEKPMDKFNELLEKYGKTAEDITFSYEGLSDEELETAFAEAFAEQEDNSGSEDLGTQQFDGDSETDPETDPEADPETDDTLDDDAGTEEDEDGDGADGEDGSDDGAANNNDESDPKRQNNELSKSELFDQLFELSFDEIRQGLNALCSIYRNDEEWCYVEDVYEDYFIMYDWDSNKVWKQSYTKDGDNLSLNGERTQLFIMLLTESEKISIENMRQNYESVCGQLAQYQKQELVASADYAAIADKEDFSKLAAEVNDGKNEMTFEELKSTVDQMLLNYAKSGNLTFAKPENRAPARMSLSPSGVKGTPKKSRYGNLFSKKR